MLLAYCVWGIFLPTSARARIVPDNPFAFPPSLAVMQEVRAHGRAKVEQCRSNCREQCMDDSMDGIDTSPRMGEGRTTQEQLSRVESGTETEQLPNRDRVFPRVVY